MWTSFSVPGLDVFSYYDYTSASKASNLLLDTVLPAGTYQLLESADMVDFKSQLSATPFTFATVPEPAACHLWLALAGMTVYQRRRRRAVHC